MAYISYTPVDIVLEIPDIVLSNTIIKRKAKMLTLNYNQPYKTVSVAWEIQHYADDNGQYGEYIGVQVGDKLKETIADNTTIVNAATGEIITDLDQYKEIITISGETVPAYSYPQTTIEIQQVVNENGELVEIEVEVPVLDENGNPVMIEVPEYTPTTQEAVYTIDWMGQYDWFNKIGETTPVIVHDLIRQYGQQADWFTNIK
jgi:hypothetical protein